MAEAWSREGIRVLFVYAVRRLIKVSFYEYGRVDKFVYFFDYHFLLLLIIFLRYYVKRNSTSSGKEQGLQKKENF